MNEILKHETALVNGKTVDTIRGPSFDIFYVLSNYLHFDLEIEQISDVSYCLTSLKR
jgi:hypothetical protein